MPHVLQVPYVLQVIIVQLEEPQPLYVQVVVIVQRVQQLQQHAHLQHCVLQLEWHVLTDIIALHLQHQLSVQLVTIVLQVQQHHISVLLELIALQTQYVQLDTFAPLITIPFNCVPLVSIVQQTVHWQHCVQLVLLAQLVQFAQLVISADQTQRQLCAVQDTIVLQEAPPKYNVQQVTFVQQEVII